MTRAASTGPAGSFVSKPVCLWQLASVVNGRYYPDYGWYRSRIGQRIRLSPVIEGGRTGAEIIRSFMRSDAEDSVLVVRYYPTRTETDSLLDMWEWSEDDLSN